MAKFRRCCGGLCGLLLIALSAGMLTLTYMFNQAFPSRAVGLADLATSKGFFAVVFYTMSQGQEEKLGPLRAELLEGIHGDVVEIGPGFGPNFRHMSGPEVTSLTVFEPNVLMHDGVREAAEAAGVADRLTIAGSLDEIADGAFDAAVSTLVLCSVPEPAEAVANLRRWLKPDGTFYFLEHVAAEEGSLGRYVQDFVQPVWGFVGDNCHFSRETWVTIENQAGWEVSWRWEEVGPLRAIFGRAKVPSSSSSS